MNALSTATIHEAYGQRGALPANLQGLDRSMRLFGPAYPVTLAIGDNIWLHRALQVAAEGSVLVVATMPRVDEDGADTQLQRDVQFGYWGEIMTLAARARGIRGLVIDGCVRDREALVRSGFPVFCRGVSLRGTQKSLVSPGSSGDSIAIGGVAIELGDLVVGDADGVVVVSRSEVAIVVERAKQLARRERTMIARLNAGESTLKILGLERP